MCKKAGREESVAKEEAELSILKDFVNLFPQELQAQI
jgi:uncharacterized protein YqeY